MVTKTHVGVLLLAILSVSIYVQMDEQVKLHVDNYKSVFSVWEDDKWVVSGKEYSRLFDGVKLSYADKREVTSEVNGNLVTIKRLIEYKNGAKQINTYSFDGSIDDKELFPISHQIEMFNAKGKILEYTARELLYTGESRIATSPESFGHSMKVEWEGEPYIHKIYKYKWKDEAKLTLRYRIESDYEVYKIRLFDPTTTTIYLNGTSADRYFELGDQINITADSSADGNTMCISIDHPSFGDDYVCGENSTIANITITPSLTTFNDSTSEKNISTDGNFYMQFNSRDELLSSSISLTGYLGIGNMSIDNETEISNITDGCVIAPADCTLTDLSKGNDTDWDTYTYDVCGTSPFCAGHVVVLENYSYDSSWVLGFNFTAYAKGKAGDTYGSNSFILDVWNYTSSAWVEIAGTVTANLETLSGSIDKDDCISIGNPIQTRVILRHASTGSEARFYESKITYDYNETAYPFNVSIDSGNDGQLDFWMPYSYLNDSYGISDRFLENSLTKTISFSNAGTNVTYVELPCNIQANSMTLNVTGGSGTFTQDEIDSVTEKAFTFSTANTPQDFYIDIPSSATINSFTLDINGSNYYSDAGTLSGGTLYAYPNHDAGATWIKTASKAYNGTITLKGQGFVNYWSYITATLTLVGDSGSKGSCTKYNACGSNTCDFECDITVSSIQSAEDVWVTLSTNGPVYPNAACQDAGCTYLSTYFSNLNQYDLNDPDNVTIYFNTSSQALEYNYTVELNSSVGDQAVTMNTTNMQAYLDICTENPCPVRYYVNSIDSKGTVSIHSVNVTYVNSVSNITLDVGNDGTVDSSISGASISNLNMTLNSSGINAIITYMSGTCLTKSLPLVFTSETSGDLALSSLELNYSINPVDLNSTAIDEYISARSGSVDVPFNITSEYWGIINLASLDSPFYGDANYTIIANYTGDSVDNSSSTQLISIIWSNYTIEYPTGTSYFQFYPNNNNAKNVTPYKQTSTVPMFNITGVQRDRDFDLYIRVNASYPSDTNLTASNTSTKSSLIVDTSWQKIADDISVDASQGIWYWRDYFNTAARWITWGLEIRSVCDLCV